jgi:isopentenyldiphosphate isomerase
VNSRTTDEQLDIIDSEDRVIGQAPRAEVHGNPALLHRVVHVLVFDRKGRIFLQKRSRNKDVQPGKWDSSVGGHVDAGESREYAVLRELAEELGIPGDGRAAPELKFLHSYIHGNECESEMVTTWITLWEGPFYLQESEISDGRFWEPVEIDLRRTSESGSGPFTPNFLDELRRWREKGSPLP